MARKRIAANMASMMLWQAAVYLIPLVTFPYLTRVLGVRSFGEYGFAFAIVTYLVLVTDWGFSLSASAAIAREREDRAAVTRIFWNTLIAKALLASACTGALAAGVLIARPPASQVATLFAASVNIWASVLTVNWCLQGLERLGSFAAAAIFGRAMTIPGIFLFVHGPQDGWVAALIQSCGGIIGGVGSLILLARLRQIGPPRMAMATIARQIREGWHFFVSTVASSFYTNANTVVLGLVSGPAVVGIYAAADRLRIAAQGVVNPISQAIYPHTNRLIHQDRSAGLRFIRRLLLLQGSFCLCITLALFVGAPLIIRVIAGPGYEDAIPILRILSLAPLLVGISNVLGVQLMLPLGLKAQFSRVLTRVALAYIVLVPPLAWGLGARGAAIAAIVAEMIAITLMLGALAREDVRLWRPSGVPHAA